MSPAAMTTATIDRSLKLIRHPLDLMIARLPGSRSGPAAVARITVDRVDASVRAVIASLLGNDQLNEDARRRSAAADERERAVELRREAEERQAQAEGRLEDRARQAAERRERAEQQASSRRRQAERARQSQTEQARQTESRRVAANRRRDQRAEDAIEARKAAQRLPGVQAQAQALADHEQALAQADTARALGEAAAEVKKERKS